ncbi:MAG: glycoside hydrolase family 97 protein [Cyclobacteriaceae bacterium]|nr:glycoside hydrolase family 97 protein [Cyclobacteriaceae bacterium HetDA_MAG_MS6]
MNSILQKVSLCCLLMILGNAVIAQSYDITSPDATLKVSLKVSDDLALSISKDDQVLLDRIAVGLTTDTRSFSRGKVIGKPKTKSVDERIKPIYGIRSEIPDVYSEMKVRFRWFDLDIRVYNDGFGYRFVSKDKRAKVVQDELLSFQTSPDAEAFFTFPRSGTFVDTYEDMYRQRKISAMPADSIIYLPALLKVDGYNLVFSEADVVNYPHLYWQKVSGSTSTIRGTNPKYPLRLEPGGHENRHFEVPERADYIAKINGRRNFPWRIFSISKEDKGLLANDIVYRFSKPATDDFSWVQPGKVAWDWWSDLNLKHVPFKAGVNTATYKYYVDFAAKYGLEYINLDEGWSALRDLTDLSPEVDVKEVIRYADEKGIKVFLWCMAMPLERQMNEVLPVFEEWGVAGLKVDFMDRDDQQMVEFYYDLAKKAAEHKLLINFHGAYKPTGMYREFPNVVNHEAVRGLEYNKFFRPEGTSPEYAVTIPYVRAMAGYMDYTPGALTNARKQDFLVSFSRPMSQGTRAHQVAMYVMLFGPLQMLSDTPTGYEEDQKTVEFISKIPTDWDESVPLQGEVGEYAVMARRSGDSWYISAMTDWTARDLKISLSFLPAGQYNVTIFKDGINADRQAEDYEVVDRGFAHDDVIDVHLAPGGGFTAIIEKAQ